MLYLEKTINIAVVGNVPGNVVVFYFFLSLSCLAILGRYPRQKWNFRGSKFWLKNAKKNIYFFKITNFPFWAISKWTTKSTFLEKEFSLSFCPYMRCAPSGEMVLVIFQRFWTSDRFLGKKNLASIFGSLKCVIPKCTFFGPKLNRLSRYLLNSSKAHAPRGLHYIFVVFLGYNVTTEDDCQQWASKVELQTLTLKLFNNTLPSLIRPHIFSSLYHVSSQV